MTRFERRILAFSDRFLSNRTFELIVEPALADYEFEAGATRLARARHCLAVLRAVAGGLLDELSRDTGSFVVLTLVPTAYYTFLLIVFSEFLETPSSLASVSALILVLSLAPVTACFWPERHRARPVE